MLLGEKCQSIGTLNSRLNQLASKAILEGANMDFPVSFESLCGKLSKDNLFAEFF